MKGKNIILISLAVVTVAVLFFIFSRHSFSWKLSFRADDTEPYGCMLFDSIMSKTMNGNYQVVDIGPGPLLEMKEHQGKTVICLYDYLKIDPQIILNYAKNGGHVFIAANYWDYQIGRELGYDNNFINPNAPIPVEGEFLDVEYQKDSNYKAKKYKVSKCLLQTVIEPHNYKEDFFEEFGVDEDIYEEDIYEKKLKKNNYNFKWKDVVMTKVEGKQYSIMKTADYGKGKITLMSMPLLFTNYGILEENNSELIMRLFSTRKGKSIVRTSFQMERAAMSQPPPRGIEEEQKSLLNYILSEKALKAALYLAILGIVLFFIFAARRKQRIIPVIQPKENGQLEFIKQIGGLYKRSHAAENIIRKKHTMLAEKIQRKVHVDIKDPDKINGSIDAISTYTGIKHEHVQHMIYKIDAYLHYKQKEEEKIIQELQEQKVYKWMNYEQLKRAAGKKKSKTSTRDMMLLIDYMNYIERKL